MSIMTKKEAIERLQGKLSELFGSATFQQSFELFEFLQKDLELKRVKQIQFAEQKMTQIGFDKEGSSNGVF